MEQWTLPGLKEEVQRSTELARWPRVKLGEYNNGMIQDDPLLSEINTLASDERSAVIDFIQRLKARRDVQMVKSTDSAPLFTSGDNPLAEKNTADLPTESGASSLMALQGLGKELWQAMDVEQYLDEERHAWA